LLNFEIGSTIGDYQIVQVIGAGVAGLQAIATARRWWSAGDATTRKLVRHAMRTLVKQGDADALGLLGYATAAKVALTELRLVRDRIVLGDALEFSFLLRAAGKQTAGVVIDYRVHHQRANGSTTPKVFKLAKRQLVPGEDVRIERRHRIAQITTLSQQNWLAPEPRQVRRFTGCDPIPPRGRDVDRGIAAIFRLTGEGLIAEERYYRG